MKQIEKLEIAAFALRGFDPVDSALYEVEDRMDSIVEKINELIEAVNMLIDNIDRR